MTGGEEAPRPAGEPLLEIVAGHPSAEEVAALTLAISAVLAARESAARAEQAARGANAAGGWTDRSHLLRTALAHGPDAWRRSARPR
jgi:acyl-CoA carboxylase epsilon subunit